MEFTLSFFLSGKSYQVQQSSDEMRAKLSTTAEQVAAVSTWTVTGLYLLYDGIYLASADRGRHVPRMILQVLAFMVT